MKSRKRDMNNLQKSNILFPSILLISVRLKRIEGIVDLSLKDLIQYTHTLIREKLGRTQIASSSDIFVPTLSRDAATTSTGRRKLREIMNRSYRWGQSFFDLEETAYSTVTRGLVLNYQIQNKAGQGVGNAELKLKQFRLLQAKYSDAGF